MAPKECTLLAFDSVGGQALFKRGTQWFRASADEGWRPTELRDRRAAVRCSLLAPYEGRQASYRDVEALVSALEREWDERFQPEDVPLDEIIHLFPADLQRVWQIQRDDRRREADSANEQSQRIRREADVARRIAGKPVRVPWWWPLWTPWPQLEFHFAPPPPVLPYQSRLIMLGVQAARDYLDRQRWPKTYVAEELFADVALKLWSYLDAYPEFTRAGGHVLGRTVLLAQSITRSWLRDSTAALSRGVRGKEVVSLERDKHLIPADVLIDRSFAQRVEFHEVIDVINRAVDLLPEQEAKVVRLMMLYDFGVGKGSGQSARSERAVVEKELGLSWASFRNLRKSALRRLRGELEKVGIGSIDLVH